MVFMITIMIQYFILGQLLGILAYVILPQLVRG
jgi:hypothetical protein